MSTLTRKEIETRIRRDGLIRNPRCGDDGEFEIQADSYDLTAGTAIWKQSADTRKGARVETLNYSSELPKVSQPTVTVQPGQMIFVVTLEDIVMPTSLCGTVYSRNSLALAGILALNAGHVDPGYEGPIVIRLINLRAIPWTLTLGDAIFTITFQMIDNVQDDLTEYKRVVSQEEMISRVRATADAALGNALYDLYAVDIDKRLNEFQASSLEKFREERDSRWVQRDEIWAVLFHSVWSKMAAGVILIASVIAAVFTALQYLDGKT